MAAGGADKVVNENGARARGRRDASVIPAKRPLGQDDWADNGDAGGEDNESGAAKEKQNHQDLVQNLLNTARQNTKKIQASLKIKVEGIFDDAESTVDSLQADASKDVSMRIQKLKAVLDQSRASYSKGIEAQTKPFEEHLALIEHLTRIFSESLATGDAATLNAEAHVKQRQTHASKVSSKGAREAMRIQKQTSRDAQILREAKTFAEAHRFLFKSLDDSRVNITKATGS